LDIQTPFYLNIAPNQDATFTPRLMSKRGLMLGGEYRYLLSHWSGSIAATYLPEDLKDKDKRWSFNTTHRYRPTEHFVLSGSYQRVSDNDYIKHFDNQLDLSNINFVQSHLNATYLYSPNFRLVGEFKDYQLANSAYTKADKPYSVLPRLSAIGRWRFDNDINLISHTELTNFDKDDSVSGWRFDQLLSASYDFERTYGFIKPTLAYRFTGYQLRDQGSAVPEHITRTLPTFSLDSGLYFDRQMTWFGHNATQTLEPRLYYLYTPYRDQSDIPDFDTAAIDSAYDAMFLSNRFIGKDRIGDANQLTTALSSTITDNQSGRELATLAVGQIQYFADRRVSLLDSVSSASRSSVIAEGRPPHGKIAVRPDVFAWHR
ncbi:MAG: LPS biosynthesis protein, partial [Gammaproteobacteria bacterium]